MTRTKSKKEVLLLGQKLKSPKSRRKRKLVRSFRFLSTVGLAVLLLVSGIYLARKSRSVVSPAVEANLIEATKVTYPIQFDFDEISAKKLPLATQKKISDYVVSTPPNLNSQAQLLSYAKKLQEISGASSIQLIRTGEYRVIIRSNERHPLLRIAADKVRLVTADGLVYGVAETSHEDLPMFAGLLDSKNRKYTFEQDGSLILRNEEQLAIRAALEFSAESETQRFGFKKLEWLPYRGIEAKTDEWTVVFGMPPYGERYQKLVKIVSDLNKKGVSSAKVELDYPDKAFVKQTPIPQQQTSSGL